MQIKVIANRSALKANRFSFPSEIREPLINSREHNVSYRGTQAIGRIFRKRTSTSL
ncbi:hypothetical protein SAMN05660479_02038 [Microbulbifer thermotolerans]|nr:hypothetical protein SAMN05660479_02038 [Microbulbifer thermotolerans]